MKPPYVNDGDTAGVSREGHGVAEKEEVGTCKYFWQSVTASENSPDQVFRGELSMSSLILLVLVRYSQSTQNQCSLLCPLDI